MRRSVGIRLVRLGTRETIHLQNDEEAKRNQGLEVGLAGRGGGGVVTCQAGLPDPKPDAGTALRGAVLVRRRKEPRACRLGVAEALHGPDLPPQGSRPANPKPAVRSWDGGLWWSKDLPKSGAR